MPADRPDWPRTVDDADRLIERMSPEDRRFVRETNGQDLNGEHLIRFHHGRGAGMRHVFGLWQGNTTLLEPSTARR